MAAARDPRIRAVAAWAPGSVAFEGISFRKLRPGSSWTWEGNPVPYAPYRLDWKALRNPVRLLLGRPVHFHPVHERALKGAPIEAFIALERSSVSVLLLSGEDDQMAPSALMAGQLQDRMERHGLGSQVQNLVYEGAGHGMAYQLWPDGGPPETRLLHGGSLEADHLAGQAAWGEIIALFERELGLRMGPGGEALPSVTRGTPSAAPGHPPRRYRPTRWPPPRM